ncbi:hypothetical protein H257_14821 [Aphanomyces astaci]|uniref:Uncharacterized protein n=1 Tax=Aphanomyces astaci TaxID=112090 RepID=W4FPN1_APHAT|nr:hypothetical protein H257_14821 [Aphanomyces astaci]ETV69447.1 hypothetical protein H257_14821 [Aphanomyces astaci]|eukprot:XP_009841020.1 hypothetical protein H257_14821 [Aphanomyces astaci]
MAPPPSKAAVEVFFADVKPFVLDVGDFFDRNNNAKSSPPPPLPVTLRLPPVTPVVLSPRPFANATARRQHLSQPSWEVPEPLTTTGCLRQLFN